VQEFNACSVKVDLMYEYGKACNSMLQQSTVMLKEKSGNSSVVSWKNLQLIHLWDQTVTFILSFIAFSDHWTFMCLLYIDDVHTMPGRL